MIFNYPRYRNALTTLAAFSALRAYALSGGNWHTAIIIMALSMVPVVTYIVSLFASWNL